VSDLKYITCIKYFLILDYNLSIVCFNIISNIVSVLHLFTKVTLLLFVIRWWKG